MSVMKEHSENILADQFSAIGIAAGDVIYLQSLQEQPFSPELLERLTTNSCRRFLVEELMQTERLRRKELEFELADLEKAGRQYVAKAEADLARRVEETKGAETALIETCNNFDQCQRKVENLLAERKNLKKQIKELSKPGKKPATPATRKRRSPK